MQWLKPTIPIIYPFYILLLFHVFFLFVLDITIAYLSLTIFQVLQITVLTNWIEFIINCLKARVFRSYPTLVREFHFNKLLTEKAPEYNIVYNDYLDIKHDIDTLLIRDGQYWAACLYTKTKRALQARDLKKNRHKRFSNVQYIEFPVNFNNKRKLGDFFLYGKQEMNILFARINQGIPL